MRRLISTLPDAPASVYLMRSTPLTTVQNAERKEMFRLHIRYVGQVGQGEWAPERGAAGDALWWRTIPINPGLLNRITHSMLAMTPHRLSEPSTEVWVLMIGQFGRSNLSTTSMVGITIVWNTKDLSTCNGPPDSGVSTYAASSRSPIKWSPRKNSAVGKRTFCTPHNTTTRQKALVVICKDRFQGWLTIVARMPAIQLVTVKLKVRALTTIYHNGDSLRYWAKATTASDRRMLSDPNE